MTKFLGRSGELATRLGLVGATLPVVSSVGALPASPVDGQMAILRTTNHRHLMTYNSVISRWISEEQIGMSFPAGYNYNPTNSVVGVWEDSLQRIGGGLAFQPIHHDWRERDAAGLKPQMRAQGIMGDMGTGNSFDTSLSYYGMDLGGGNFGPPFPAPTSRFGPVLTSVVSGGSGWFYLVGNIAWTDIPGGWAVKDIIIPSLSLFSRGTTSYIIGGTVLIRWTN